MVTIVRVVLSFAIVATLLWAFTRAGHGRLGTLLSGAKGRSSNPITVIDRRQLTRNTGLALVRAGDRNLLLGVSDAGVQLIAEGDDLQLDIQPDADTVTGDSEIDLGPDLDLEADDPDQVPRYRSARTRLETASAAAPPRMSFLDTLRERTVRRS